jgi:general secretion pathway protein L
VELDGGADRHSLNLMPSSIEEKESKGWLRRLLPLIALGLAAAAIILPLSKQQRLLEEIDQEMTVVRAEAEESLAIRGELDRLARKAGFLTGEKNRRSTMTEILAELTRVIPDHSHIIQLQIQGTKIELNGLADKASDLIAILDQSELLDSPQFRSPVTRDPRADKERFQISVDVKERTP